MRSSGQPQSRVNIPSVAIRFKGFREEVVPRLTAELSWFRLA
jgi:hypothetical protein